MLWQRKRVMNQGETDTTNEISELKVSLFLLSGMLSGKLLEQQSRNKIFGQKAICPPSPTYNDEENHFFFRFLL